MNPETLASLLLEDINPDLHKAAQEFLLFNGWKVKGGKEAEAYSQIFSYGVDPNLKATRVSDKVELGDTALVSFALRGFAVLIDILIENGADPNIPDSFGDTPVGCAALYDHLPAVESLLKGGADPKIAGRKKRTPLHYAADNYTTSLWLPNFLATNNDLNLIDTLLKAGADINAQDEEGNTPLMSAVKSIENKASISTYKNRLDNIDPNKTIIKFLLDRGADPNIANSNGVTPLMLLKNYGTKWASMLEKYGAKGEKLTFDAIRKARSKQQKIE